VFVQNIKESWQLRLKGRGIWDFCLTPQNNFVCIKNASFEVFKGGVFDFDLSS